MRDKTAIYGTVPINLLQNIHEDQEGTIIKMFDYAIYDRMRKLYPTLEHDDFDDSGIEESMQYFGLNPKVGTTKLKTGKELYDTFQGTPNASINIKKLLEFQKGKTEFELMVFCFYCCAIRSIIGTKPYYKGTDDYWIARAFGYSSKGDFENSLPTQKPTQKETELRVKYSNRYWLDKIKLALQNDWYLVYLSTNKHIKMRGFYVSIKMPLDRLTIIAKSKNEKNKSKLIERKETIARVFNGNRDVPF